MSLTELHPKTEIIEVTLLCKQKVDVSFRPFILADKAWWEQNFDEKERIGLENLEVEPMCKAIWNQLDVKSKK